MKKILASVISAALISSLILASGCVVRPAGYGYRHHHHHGRW